MSKLNDLKCPNCGSTPRYNKEKKVFVCKYCGTELARDYKLTPKDEKLEDLIKNAIIDFEGSDFDNSFRKFSAALNLDPDNICLKFNKEATKILKNFHHPDVPLYWDDAYDALKEVYDSNVEKNEKSDCFETFISMAIETFDYRFNESLSNEESANCINYAASFLKKLYNELDLSNNDKLTCLNALEDLIRQSIGYFSSIEDSSYDLSKSKEQLKEVEEEIKNISNN